MSITLEAANRIISQALKIARERSLSPITICVLDRGGHLVSAQREDESAINSSILSEIKSRLVIKVVYATESLCMSLYNLLIRFFRVSLSPDVLFLLSIQKASKTLNKINVHSTINFNRLCFTGVWIVDVTTISCFLKINISLNRSYLRSGLRW